MKEPPPNGCASYATRPSKTKRKDKGRGNSHSLRQDKTSQDKTKEQHITTQHNTTTSKTPQARQHKHNPTRQQQDL